MPDYFFDTTAIAKHYHAETGTAKADALLATAGSSHTVSRLGVVELHSVFAKKFAPDNSVSRTSSGSFGNSGKTCGPGGSSPSG